MDELLARTREILDQTGRISIRHLCYLMSSADLLEKTERAFKTYGEHLTKWRRRPEIPWRAFTDSTRWHYGAETYDSIDECLEDAVQTYRRDLWQDLPVHIEIWCEKDAIVPILLEVARRFRVKVLPFRGFTSFTSLGEAAETFREYQERGKKVHVYYFGDWDPSGRLVEPAAERTLRVDFDVDVSIERMAVTPAQIHAYDLPTRPTKTKKNTHAKGFKAGQSRSTRCRATCSCR